MAKKVVLKGHSGAQYKEAIAEAAITPGHLIELDTTTQKAQKQASKFGLVAVAIENHWVGGGLNTAYAADDRVVYQVLKSGAEFQALVGTSVAAIAYGDLVKANTAKPGTVVKIGADEEDLAIGICRLAVDNSGNAATEVRTRVEVL